MSSPADTNYEVTHLIAEEATTLIYHGLDTQTGERVAIKLPKPGCNQTTQESQILMYISHPYIIPLRDIVETESGPALVFPYAQGGDLYNAIEDGGIPESEVKAIVFRLLQALAYLHEVRIWHLDVKPENVLIMSDNLHNIVLCDFGLAAGFPEDTLGDVHRGSVHYAAPEIWRKVGYTEKVDIWSLGMTMFVALTASFPFDISDHRTVADAVVQGLPDLMFIPSLAKLSAAGKDLLRSMLQVDPAKRISAEEALLHEWFAPLLPEADAD